MMETKNGNKKANKAIFSVWIWIRRKLQIFNFLIYFNSNWHFCRDRTIRHEIKRVLDKGWFLKIDFVKVLDM